MKKLILLLIIASSSLTAQNMQGFHKSLKANDASAISSLLDSDITYCENDNQEFLGKNEASKKLSNFFAKKTITDIEEIHSGSSNKTNYRVSKVITKAGTFRLFLYFENSKVTELRINKY